MKRAALSVLVALACVSPAVASSWQVTEQVKPYAISGSTPMELYEAIGAKGPLLGGSSRAIAHTTFDLKWSRDYRPQSNGACRLVSAKPWLTIIYTLPRPSGTLEPALKARWDRFHAGIKAHEEVHGQMIRELVQTVHDTTVGLTVENDPNCRKIREAIQKPLADALNAHRARSREFDRVEMAQGANIHRLILALVEGR